MKKYCLILLIIITTICFFTDCNNKKKERFDISSKKELKHIDYSFDNPPKFRKDGVLKFINKENEVLFSIDIEVVSTREEHGRGLMYRPEMAENRGMLFMMESEAYQSFYMKNTIISLDIIYINSNFEIVDIYKNTNTLDETSLPSAKPALYVVEVNSGICEKYNINIGDKIEY